VSEKSVAVPVSVTEFGLPIPLLEIVRVASRRPPPEGVSFTLIWQDALNARVGVEPHRLSKEKSPTFAPVIEIDRPVSSIRHQRNRVVSFVRRSLCSTVSAMILTLWTGSGQLAGSCSR
jgi:hypothetical protein